MARVPIYVIFNVDLSGYMTKITSNTLEGIQRDPTVDKHNVQQGNFECLNCQSRYRMKFYFKFPTSKHQGRMENLIVRYESEAMKVEEIEDNVAKKVKDFIDEIEDSGIPVQRRVIQMDDGDGRTTALKRKALSGNSTSCSKKLRKHESLEDEEEQPMKVESLIEYEDEIPDESNEWDAVKFVDTPKPKLSEDFSPIKEEMDEEVLEEDENEMLGKYELVEEYIKEDEIVEQQNENPSKVKTEEDEIIEDEDRPWWDPIHLRDRMRYFNDNSECTMCGEFVPTQPSHKRWIHLSEKHGVFQRMCDICGKLFIGSSLAKHLATHEKTQKIEFSKQRRKSEKNYCAPCDQTFFNLPQWERHQQDVHGIEPCYRCDRCPYFASKHRNLENHIKRKHTDAVELPHYCQFCDRRFADTHYLRAHMLTHSEQRAFECFQCGNKYKRKPELMQHMYVHTGELPYACKFCGKRFNDRGNKNAHQRKTHREEYEADKKEQIKKGKFRGRTFDL